MRIRLPRLGCLGSLIVVPLILALGYLAFIAAAAPWSFFVGGAFHIVPGWRAWGRLHSPAEGDYLLWVQLLPDSPGRTTGLTYMTGRAEICSPRGTILTLRLVGDMDRGTWLDIDGKRVSIHLFHRAPFTGLFSAERRPRLDLHGEWRGPMLELDDRGTVSQAFTADGAPFLGPPARQPRTRWSGHITLRTGSHADFAAACHALGH